MIQQYRFAYFIAIVFSLFSIFKTLFGLSAPSPQGEGAKQLRLTGHHVVPLATDPAKQGRDFSHGPIQHFQLQDKGTQQPLVLTVMQIRSRNEKTLQMARMAEFEPKFYLRQRHLQLLSSSTSQKSRPYQLQEVAIGRSPLTTYPPVVRLQSCLTPGGRAAVTMASIQNHLYDQRAHELARNPIQARLSRFLGLQPNTRWECLAVQLESPEAPGAETTLIETWSKLR
jgi:hypothetical protein